MNCEIGVTWTNGLLGSGKFAVGWGLLTGVESGVLEEGYEMSMGFRWLDPSLDTCGCAIGARDGVDTP